MLANEHNIAANSPLRWTFASGSLVYIATGFLCIRCIVGLLHAFRPIVPPHIWRQVDTLGVTLRYWLRWTVEQHTDVSSFLVFKFIEPLIPAVLNSGDGKGYMAMEFPFLNILLAPSFFLGVETGRMMSFVALGTLIVLQSYCAYGAIKGLRSPPFAADVALLVPIFSFATPYTWRFIPDLFATQCVFLGILLSWENSTRSRMIVATGLLALGGLIKPTALTALALYVIHPNVFALAKRIWKMLTASFVPIIGYYFFVIPKLRALETQPSLFLAEAREIAGTVSSLFSVDLFEYFDFFSYHAFGLGTFIVVLLMLLSRRLLPVRPLKLIFLLLLQIVAICVLAGKHALLHSYYFSAASITCAALFSFCWKNTPYNMVRAALCFTCFFRIMEVSFMDLRAYFDKTQISSLFSECSRIKESVKDIPWGTGYAFRSSYESYPLIPLCFGERGGAHHSSYGFYYANEQLPKDCAALHNSPQIRVVSCQ